MEKEFVTMKEAMKTLGLCRKTLQNYDKEGKIETIRTNGNWRKFNVNGYLKEHNIEITKKIKKNIIYARVSSNDRKEDLKRQVEYLQSKYPSYEIITDIGSGINFKRNGLQKIIEYGINDNLENLVVTYKDRLCRIGFELIEHILTTYSKTLITIENNNYKTAEEDITEDLIEIITVYSSKLHGKRSNKIV